MIFFYQFSYSIIYNKFFHFCVTRTHAPFLILTAGFASKLFVAYTNLFFFFIQKTLPTIYDDDDEIILRIPQAHFCHCIEREILIESRLYSFSRYNNFIKKGGGKWCLSTHTCRMLCAAIFIRKGKTRPRSTTRVLSDLFFHSLSLSLLRFSSTHTQTHTHIIIYI